MTTRFLFSVSFAMAFVVLAGNQPAHARAQYLKRLLKVYPKQAQRVPKVKCAECHIGKGKKNRNAYGKKLWIALGKKRNVKNQTIIDAALKKIGPPKMPKPAPPKREILSTNCGKLRSKFPANRSCGDRPSLHTKTPAASTRKPQVFHIAVLDNRRRNILIFQYLLCCGSFFSTAGMPPFYHF